MPMKFYAHHMHNRLAAAAAACAILTLPHLAVAQTASEIPPSLVTPDRIESRLGELEFKDGVPDKATADKLFDNLDLTYAYRAFMDNMRGVSIHAVRKGMQSIGVKDNEVLVFSELMDAKSLFLTANADTIYVMGFLDLTKGPVVLEAPPEFLGAVQDAWFRWVIDLGLPGPDRGEGGKYLIVSPDYNGPLRTVGFSLRAPKPIPSCGSAARPCKTRTIPSPWSKPSLSSPRSIRTVTEADKNYFDGAKTYKVTLPKDIPEANFWSLTVYDNMTRSMLDTPQHYPRAGSQSYPSPAAEPNADGSTTIYFGPSQPAGVNRGNWIQTVRGKGWFTILQDLAAQRDRIGALMLAWVWHLRVLTASDCRLLAQSAHRPVSEVKRTSADFSETSAPDPEQTYRASATT